MVIVGLHSAFASVDKKMGKKSADVKINWHGLPLWLPCMDSIDRRALFDTHSRVVSDRYLLRHSTGYRRKFGRIIRLIDSTDWLWLIDRLVDWLIDWLIDWVSEWTSDWCGRLIDWLIDWLIVAFSDIQRSRDACSTWRFTENYKEILKLFCFGVSYRLYYSGVSMQHRKNRCVESLEWNLWINFQIFMLYFSSFNFIFWICMIISSLLFLFTFKIVQTDFCKSIFYLGTHRNYT